MNRRSLLIVLIAVAVVTLVGVVAIYYRSPSANAADKEYARIDAISQSVKMPSELTWQSKTKMYDALSTADGAGWTYQYRTSAAGKKTCDDIQQRLTDAGYTPVDNACKDYGDVIFDGGASNTSKNIIVDVRVDNVVVTVDWSKPHSFAAN